MAKAEIIVVVDQPDEVRAVAEWFARWRDRLTVVDGDNGCGCCVNIWNVEGPVEAMRELPEAVVAYPGIES